MANRSVRPKVLRNLRRINSVAPYIGAVPPVDITWRPTIPAKKRTPITPTPPTTAADGGGTTPVIDLADTKSLFSSITTPKLLKSAVTLHVSSLGPMVDLGTAIMNSGLMNNPVTRNMILGFTEKTFYDHFCAGKDLQTASSTAVKLWNAGLSAMLDYGLEHADDNESCDRSLEEFLRTIEWNKMLEPGQVSFVVVKITAICPPTLLKRVSDLLRWQSKDNSMNLPWKLKSLPIFSDSSPIYHTPKRPDPLTRDEESDLELAYARVTKICDSALETGVPLLIDAEDTAIQPAIDYFTYSAAINGDENDKPLIFNTIQAYLKDAKDRLVIAKRAADEMGVAIGFKLVRGAYMSSENRLAASLGVETPIHDTIEKTHACYNQCAAYMLEEVASGTGSVVLATHNIESGKMAAAKAVSLGMERGHPCLQFAQLYGMAEALSFGLRNAGFRVSKYLPFGPVEQIMPYLLRRAEENRGVLSTSSVDKMLMR